MTQCGSRHNGLYQVQAWGVGIEPTLFLLTVGCSRQSAALEYTIKAMVPAQFCLIYCAARCAARYEVSFPTCHHAQRATESYSGFSLKPFRGLPYPQSLSPPLLASASTVCPWQRRWRYAPNPSPPSARLALVVPLTPPGLKFRFLAPRLNADG